MFRRLMFFSVFLLLIMPAAAQEKPDTVYFFRFVPGKDMFYVPWSGNDQELARLEACVEKYKQEILDGEIPLYVDGYCLSQGSRKENLNTAYLRASRVKSELIVRQKLTENCFITGNHAAEGDFVIVRFTIPTPKATTSDAKAETIVPADNTSTQPVTAPDKEKEPGYQTEETIAITPNNSKGIPFYLHTNLLRWATLTTDLGLEYRPAPRLGILVGGSFANWGWKDKTRRYRLWEVTPELRTYLGKEYRGFLGAMYKVGEYNYKLGHEGKKGNLWGVGLSGGYRLKLNRSLGIDFHAAVGYTHAEYDKYTRIGGENVSSNKSGKLTKELWGVNHLGVTLIWQPFN